MRRLLFAATCCLISATPAMAITGNQLAEYGRHYELMSKNDRSADSMKAAMFMGYVLGVCDEYFKEPLPDGVTLGQLCQVVKKSLDEFPESLHKKASEQVKLAILTSLLKAANDRK